uniref:Uncharacterized protein n=1 Tax=Euplotes harpa TaxID=151035 RepID=A0A7S3N9K4_9SPIT|mmetsp:Transcript_26634/g.30771  ORF Transcript_26634/g.30771 Transcript_26634/m.30771 type:complete len:153 (+) Transcript_26634:72-530(+)
MAKAKMITKEDKANLKYLVFLNDANLFSIFNNDFSTIEEVFDEIKHFSKNITKEVVDEELKNTEMLNFISNESKTSTQVDDEAKEEQDQMAIQSSPIGTFLQKRKKNKKPDTSANFSLDGESQSTKEADNAVVNQCGPGESPKFIPVRRSKK